MRSLILLFNGLVVFFFHKFVAVMNAAVAEGVAAVWEEEGDVLVVVVDLKA